MKQGKNLLKSKVIILLISLFMLCSVRVDTQAAGTTTYKVTGTYLQTSARDMLSTINSLRTSGNAWVYDRNNNKEKLGKLGTLQIDYDLEKIAMQRAMEISVRYGHTRPNNSSCFTYTYNGTSSYGENIIASSGPVSTQQAYNMWLEEYEKYDGQGHRRNMLNSGYTVIGIAHVERNGCHFWVQEFGYSKSSAAQTPALNGAATVSVDVLNDWISSYLLDSDDWGSVDLTYGDTFDLGEITEYITAAATRIEPPVASRKPSGWTSSDNNIALISGNKLAANKVGSTKITTKSANGKSVSIPVNVTARHISYASINLDKYDYEYTGNAITPAFTITYAGKTLTAGTDYTVSYSNNTNPGTAKATITGTGNFRGTTSKTFYINKKGNGGGSQNPRDEDNKGSSNQENKKDNSEERLSATDAKKLLDDGRACIIDHVVYTINGTDAQVSYCTSDISSYTAPKYVTIAGTEYKVTSIAGSAFKKMKTLKKVDLSKAEIKSIGANAFSGDSSLKTIKLNALTLKKINKNAFKKISAKAKFTIIAKDKKTYDKIVSKVKKAGIKTATFKRKK